MTFDSDVPMSALYGQAALFERVSKQVLPTDSMYAGNPVHYFSVGASAMAMIARALELADVPINSVERVLDYACGYGRVLRWLRAAFPNAYVKGVDANLPSVEAAAALNVDTEHLDISLSKRIGDKFDLIWIGSLFTHLTATETGRVIRYLRNHFSDNGILLCTTHGVDVINRIESGERNYGLDADGIATVIKSYKGTGYGYADYPRQLNYGISVARPVAMNQLITTSGLFPFMFRAQGWDNHQDVFACTIQK
jgi:SAM-dependent methyltransferase